MRKSSGGHHRSWLVPRMPATETVGAHILQDRDAPLHVDGSFRPKDAVAFPAPHRMSFGYGVVIHHLFNANNASIAAKLSGQVHRSRTRTRRTIRGLERYLVGPLFVRKTAWPKVWPFPVSLSHMACRVVTCGTVFPHRVGD
jgi:hypothetical protein